jgi:hypothetical protein
VIYKLSDSRTVENSEKTADTFPAGKSVAFSFRHGTFHDAEPIFVASHSQQVTSSSARIPIPCNTEKNKQINIYKSQIKKK